MFTAKRLSMSGLCFCMVLIFCISIAKPTFALLMEDSTKQIGWSQRPTTGTDYAFAIYCSGPSMNQLPQYWQIAWANYYYTIPGFFAKMSDSAYTLVCDPYANGNQPFHYGNLDPGTDICISGVNSFADSILMVADTFIYS